MKSNEEVGVHERKLWFGLLARGVLAMLFALGAIATPHITIGTVGILFGVYAVADSVISLFAADRLRRAHNRKIGWLFATEGILSAALAVVAFVAPGGVLLLRVIGGARAIALGTSDFLWAHRSKASIQVEVAGFCSIGLGFLLLVWPGPGTLALPWLIGLPSLMGGALMVTGALSEIQHEEHLEA